MRNSFTLCCLLAAATATSSFSQSVIRSEGTPPLDRFEVVSLRLNTSGSTSMKFSLPSNGRFTATNIPLSVLITFAHGILRSRIFDAPGWMDKERFDLDARAARPDLTGAEYQQMLRSRLIDRFKLQTHRETRDLPSYELSIAKAGPHLTPADPARCDPFPAPADNTTHKPTGVACGTFYTDPGTLDARSMTMPQFSNTLSIILGRPVADRTGVTGRFDFHLEFDPQGVNLGNGPAGLSTDTEHSAASQPSIFSALEQKLGLRLQSQKAPSEILLIDHLERLPTDN